MRRTDPSETKFFRTDRFFRSDGLWYFATREGLDFGPFTIRPDGEKALLRYIDTQQTMQTLRANDPTRAAEDWDAQSVARTAREIADWRFDRTGRSGSMYSDRAHKHK